MNYKEFQNEILKLIGSIMEANYDTNLHRVVKNNDIELVAITIHEKNVAEAVPTIYLEDFYEMYCAGVSLMDIANNIIAIYYRQKGMINITIDDFKDFESVKDKIMLKLVNYERNQFGLVNTPHIRIMDLAIVFYVYWEDSNGESMISTVRDTHMSLWGIGIDELHMIAYENTIAKLSVSIRNMKDVVYELYKKSRMRSNDNENIELELFAELEEYAWPMYIISNQKKILGAGIILYDKVLKYFYSKFGGEYYILPSSIHEVIVIPKIDMTIEEMKKMVTQINENEVDYQEVLSDNVYCYNGRELAMA